MKENRNFKRLMTFAIALTLCFTAFAVFPTISADSVSGAAGTAAYYNDGSQGVLNPSDGNTWEFTLYNIDDTGITTGTNAYQLIVHDAGSSSGWESVGIQIHKDFYGVGGHLFQMYTCLPLDGWAWIVRSSHGFNSGDITGAFNIRIELIKNSDGTYTVTPYFRLSSGSWTQFWDGPWTSNPSGAGSFDLTRTENLVQIDGGAGGTLNFDPPLAYCQETTTWYVFPPIPIQYAINKASNGDIIQVLIGTYYEHVIVDKELTIQAGSTPIIDGSGSGNGFNIASDGVTIDGFEIKNCANGIFSYGTDNSIVQNNAIHDNFNTGYAGVGIMFWSNVNDFDNNQILNNVIYNNDRQGIYIGGSYNDAIISEGNTISGNTIYNNGLNTLGNPPDNSAYGIQLSYADSNTINDNDIYGHIWDWTGSGYWFGQGIYLNNAYRNTVTNNDLHDNNYGVVQYTDGGRTIGGNYVNCNNIYGNTEYGIRNYDAVEMDATCNWWGDTSGPTHSSNPSGIGDAVSDNVDFDPWITGLTLTEDPQPAFNVILEATLTDSTPAGMQGYTVNFYIDGSYEGSSETDTNGVATLDISPYPVGVYTVTAEICCLESDPILLAVYDSSAGFVTGGGWIYSPAGACIPDPEAEGKANFGFISKYKKGQSTPSGNTEFKFKAGNLNFHSSEYDWLVITGGGKAMYKGTGTINGAGEYKFMITAWDGQINGGVDKFRIKIWGEDGNGDEIIVYDNGVDTPLGGGQIKIHKN